MKLMITLDTLPLGKEYTVTFQKIMWHVTFSIMP